MRSFLAVKIWFQIVFTGESLYKVDTIFKYAFLLAPRMQN